MKLSLVLYPDPVLRRPSRPIPVVTDELRHLAGEMFRIMYETRGVGLAGPQVGYGYQIFVLNVGGRPDDERVFLNPEIVARSGEIVEEEGCLSFPGIVARIARAERATLRATDLEGREVTLEGEGLLAKAFQHEMDHLDGILIIDRMTPAERLAAAPQLKDLEKQYAQNAPRRASPENARAGRVAL